MGIIALPPEYWMLFDSYFDDKISVDVALALELESGPVIDAPWYFELLTALDHFYSFAGAVIAGTADGLACACAARTLSPHDHDALVESHKASSVAVVALLRLRAGLCPGSLANTAGASSFQLNYLNTCSPTFVAPLTDSLKSMSYFTVMSSEYSSVVAFPPLRPLRPPPPIAPPKRSSKMDWKSSILADCPLRPLNPPKPPFMLPKMSSFSKP